MHRNIYESDIDRITTWHQMLIHLLIGLKNPIILFYPS